MGQVEVLARSVGEKNDVSYTCEVAEQYYLSKVKTTINTYLVIEFSKNFLLFVYLIY